MRRRAMPALRTLLLAPALVLALLPGAGMSAGMSAGAAGEQERPHLSGDPAVNRARALIQAGEHEAALSILRPLAATLAAAGPGRADRTDIRFLTGLAAVRAAQRPGRTEESRDALLDEAIAALRAILVERPGLVRVRLELARAFFLKREDGLARDHFERVLAGRPNPAVAANVRRFLGEMRARRRWSAHFGMALASDSNLNAASADDTVKLTPHRELSLEHALEFIAADECIEVTPNHVRLRKVHLDPQERHRAAKALATASPG